MSSNQTLDLTWYAYQYTFTTTCFFREKRAPRPSLMTSRMQRTSAGLVVDIALVHFIE